MPYHIIGHHGPIGWDTGYTGELQDFADCILDGKQPDADISDAIKGSI